jgi:hypothetical protein
VIETGMRLSEQLSLRWENIGVAKRTAFIPAQITKTKRSRTVALTDKALEVLKEMGPFSFSTFNLLQGVDTLKLKGVPIVCTIVLDLDGQSF